MSRATMQPAMRCSVPYLLLLVVAYSYGEQSCPTPLTSKTVFVADPENCRNYLICNSTVQMKMTCPYDQCFDAEINACSYKDVINCTNSNGNLYPDCSNCTQYWECANGRKVHMNCPVNLWFNYLNNRCDYIRNYPLLHGCGDIRCTEGPDRKKYIVEDDEVKFVWCLEGKAYLYSCQEGNKKCYFDYEHQQCVCGSINGTEIDNSIVKYRHLTISRGHREVEESSPSICRSAPSISDLTEDFLVN